ncbi:MAG TPA: arsenic metallochaperone ArsD family protein [Holophaga sp.]|nr:arsenic metallochaperone ArsD family protein [Holophaga sp.]
MTKVQVFELTPCPDEVRRSDPSRGVFERDMAWLAKHGVEVERYNLREHIGIFATTDPVKKAMDREQESCLPLILIDGRVASSGAFPERETLADLLELDMSEETTTLVNESVAELIALAAATAAGSERAFQVHHDRAVGMGVAKSDLIQAVNIGLTVKALPHQTVMDLAQRLLVGEGGGCCGCGGGGEEGCSEEGCGEGGCGCN